MPSPTDDAGLESSVTQWLQRLGRGDREAAEQLWGRYFQHMVRMARGRLAGRKRAAADEEDVALSAFRSFCSGVEQGRFPRLTDRDGLWSLLVAITAHKSVDLVRRETRQKRGGPTRPNTSPDHVPTGTAADRDPAFDQSADRGGVTGGEARGGDPREHAEREHAEREHAGREFANLVQVDLDGLISREPTPEFAAQVADECSRLLSLLDEDETLRSVALWRMEGWSVEDIAVKLDCVPRTVKRKLRRIRVLWIEAAPSTVDAEPESC